MGLLPKMRHHRDDVFVAGGQPTVTYVQRSELHVERELARAVATPNTIVSLAGPTKTGKTVLCRNVLGSREYVWIDGGQVVNADAFWKRVCSELTLPDQLVVSEGDETSGSVRGSVPAIITASGSRLGRRSATERHELNGLQMATAELLARKIVLVVDDFHYIDPDTRKELLRNLKGPVFGGLKVILLSVTHRAFDAIKAEPELTGRFTAIDLPIWSAADLVEIAELGFQALGVKYSPSLVSQMANEAQSSPFLMQTLGWEVCYDNQISEGPLESSQTIAGDYDITEMCRRLSRDAGLPIYQQLVAGPQSRKKRAMRPLRKGGAVDIYQAILLALAETGPAPSVSYDDLRESLTELLSDQVPRKHEITAALKHLSSIARKTSSQSAIDWDEDKRVITVADPYLRFYLRWQVRQTGAQELEQDPLLPGLTASH